MATIKQKLNFAPADMELRKGKCHSYQDLLWWCIKQRLMLYLIITYVVINHALQIRIYWVNALLFHCEFHLVIKNQRYGKWPLVGGFRSYKMSTNKPQTWMMVQSCRTTELVKQNRSIDLATGFLIAIINNAEIVMIAKIKLKKRIYKIVLMSLTVSGCMFVLLNVLVSSIFLSQNCKLSLLGKAHAFYVFFVMASVFRL